MPQNMQKKPNEVASLELDDSHEEGNVEEIRNTDEATAEAKYKLALHYLERGLDKKKIADQLVQQGISRPEATALVTKVWRENSKTRLQNVQILWGAGVFFIVIGFAFLAYRLINEGALPIFSPAYVMILFGIYLAVRGYFDSREIQ